MNETICKQFFGTMNLAAYYNYTENIRADASGYKPFDPSSNAGTVDDEGTAPHEGEKRYDPDWGGMFSDREIQYLNHYYEKLNEAFVLDNWNLQDYARKVSLASLNANIKIEENLRGSGSMKDYKEALDTFDNLCKSANFAECRRKPGESTGLGNLGEIVARIEQTGLLQTTKVEFEPDDIDKILDDFQHIISAAGLGGSNDI